MKILQTSLAAVFELDAPSSGFDGMFLVYLECLALISSNDISSDGCIILLVAPVVAIVFTLSLLLLPGVFVVGGALIVAAKKIFKKNGNSYKCSIRNRSIDFPHDKNSQKLHNY